VKKNYNLYLGKAGHLTVMSEFLIRGWNVAIPEVDIGDDIFVVQDENGTLRRVQVKTSMSTPRLNNFSGQFNIPLPQLKNISSILVHYVFIARHGDRWTQPLIIRQDFLLSHWQNNHIGSEHRDNLNLYFSYSDNKVECSGLDLSGYVYNFSDFPFVD
jgi:hypothetical protein